MSELAEKLIDTAVSESTLSNIARARSTVSQARANYDPYGPEVEKAEDAYFRIVRAWFKVLEKKYNATHTDVQSDRVYKMPNAALADMFYNEVLDAFETGAFDYREVGHSQVSPPFMKGSYSFVKVRDVWGL